MRIGQYGFRKPWVKYVEMEIEEKIYWEIRRSILKDMIEAEIQRMNNTPRVELER